MRLSRGRSTPTRRAMNGSSFQGLLRPFGTSRWSGRVASRASWLGLRPSVPEVIHRRTTAKRSRCWMCSVVQTGWGSALTLLVTRVLADHHDAAVATDHLALVTDRLDARVDLHVSPFSVGWSFTCTGRRCDPG